MIAAVDSVLVKARTSNEQLLSKVLEIAERRRTAVDAGDVGGST